MPKITIYSTATCAYCKALKSYLQSKGIAYEEKHADKNKSITEELFEISGQMAVPFTVIVKEDGGEEKVLGFDKQRIDAALGLA